MYYLQCISHLANKLLETDAETTGGGFPGWVGNIAGSLRTNNAAYQQGTPQPLATEQITD